MQALKRTMVASAPDVRTWERIIRDAYGLFDDLEARGFGAPPFSLGGGTVLMLNYKHRLSKDIDLFGYDAQWLGLVNPRLNEKAAALAVRYTETSNAIKIEMTHGDIDFIIAADVTPHNKTWHELAGRVMAVDPPSEILAKKLFYRAANFQPRDVYDMSAVIDLAPAAARKAAAAAASKRDVLMLRLNELAAIGETGLLRGIVPYDGTLTHGAGMIAKVKDFVGKAIGDPNPADDNHPGGGRASTGRRGEGRGRGETGR